MAQNINKINIQNIINVMYKAEFNFLIKNKNVYSAIYELIIIAECNYNYVTKIKF